VLEGLPLEAELGVVADDALDQRAAALAADVGAVVVAILPPGMRRVVSRS
jgi:hypothetical protein